MKKVSIVPVVNVVLLFSTVSIVGSVQNYANDIKIRKMSTVKRFEDLEVWKLARELCNEVYQLTLHEAFSKDFGLKDQIRNSSGSIMDNSAEGFERDGNKEFGQFLSISKGLCGECSSQLYRAFDCHYITTEQFNFNSQKTIGLGGKNSNLMLYLKKSEIEAIYTRQ